MQRGNFRNISNNFVQGGTYHQQQPQQQQQASPRQTRSSNVQPTVPSSAVITLTPEVQPIPSVIPAVPQQPAPTAVVPMSIDNVSANGNKSFSEDELMKLKKINFKKKVTGKEKRLRQNKKLFRMLTPRNAIAALNELHGQSINETTVVPIQGNKFEAEIVINNVRYQGQGTSKMSAKNSACEKALRDLVINKFQQVKNHEAIAPTTEDVNMEDGDSTTDVPMLQLASFALHKLFAEWEAEGFEIPLPKINTEAAPQLAQPAADTKVVAKAPKIRSELPPNNETMHPVMLMSVMRPCTQFSDLGSQGITPNILHTVGCTVDGQSFLGNGRSKKEARKKVATEILTKLFNWNPITTSS